MSNKDLVMHLSALYLLTCKLLMILLPACCFGITESKSDFSNNATVWYSVPTTSKTPAELSSEPWYRSDSGSVEVSSFTGNNEFLATGQELPTSTFECTDIGCTNAVTISNNPCGPNGKCGVIGGNSSGTECVCQGLFAGPRCEFGPSSTYTSQQLEDIYAVTKNATNYPIFLQSIMTSNAALNNNFYEQYWKESIKEFFQQAETKGLTKDEVAAELQELFSNA
jgi:hypothetical protein